MTLFDFSSISCDSSMPASRMVRRNRIAWPARRGDGARARQRARRAAGDGRRGAAGRSGCAAAPARRAWSIRQPKLADGRAFGVDRADEARLRRGRLEHAEHRRVLLGRAGGVAARRGRPTVRTRVSLTSGASLERAGELAARGVEPGELARRSSTTATTGCSASLAMRAPMPPKMHDHQHREQRAEQEQEEGARKHRRGEIAAGDDEGGADQFAHHSSSAPLAHRARRAVAGDGDEGVVQAGPLDRQRLDPGAAVDQRLEQRLGAALGQLEDPFAAFAAGIAGNRGAPRPVARRGCAGGRSGAAGRAPRRRSPSNATLPPAMIAIRSHSRSAWAMTWVEKMIVAPASASRADQRFELALVDRVEARRRARRGRSGAACGRSCRAIGRSAPCPSTRCGSASSPIRRGRARRAARRRGGGPP